MKNSLKIPGWLTETEINKGHCAVISLILPKMILSFWRISYQLLDGLLWNSVHTFITPFTADFGLKLNLMNWHRESPFKLWTYLSYSVWCRNYRKCRSLVLLLAIFPEQSLLSAHLNIYTARTLGRTLTLPTGTGLAQRQNKRMMKWNWWTLEGWGGRKGCFEFYNSPDSCSETEIDWQVVSDKVL